MCGAFAANAQREAKGGQREEDADLARVKAWGYVPLPLVRPHPLFAVYVRGDTTAVNRHELSAALDERFAVR